MFNNEEVDHTIGMLQEWLSEHDDNRIRVQEQLDDVCNKLREQLESMSNKIQEKLEENFKKEDDGAQEVLSELRDLACLEGEKDEGQKARLAELMTKAKAILLVKQSYELKKPDAEKAGRKFKLTPFSDNISYGDYEEYLKEKFVEIQEVLKKKEEDDMKDPDLSNLYELDVKSDIVVERLCIRTPTELKVARASAGRVYLSFTKSFSSEEERVLSEHNLMESIVYKVAIRRDGSDKWVEHELAIRRNEKEGEEGKEEYFFTPFLRSDVTFFLKVRCVMKGQEHNSEWSECIEFVPRFSEVCGWSACTEKGSSGKDAYSISEENPMTIKFNGFHDRIRAITTVTLPQNKVTSWNFKLAEVTRRYVSIYVGVHSLIDDEGNDVDDDGNRREDNNDRDDKANWILDCNSVVPYKTKNDLYDKEKMKNARFAKRKLKKGDVVGVVMDTTKGEISFYVNGVNLGVAFDGIPLDKPLVPCVYLEDKNDAIELDLSEVKENLDEASAVPTGITVTENGWDALTLSWNLVGGTSFYQIEVDGSKSWSSKAENSFTFNKLSPDSEHSFRVRSVFGGRVSAWSEVVKGKTAALPDFSECVWGFCYNERGREISKEKRSSARSLIDSNNPRVATCSTYDDTFDVVGSVMLQPNKVTSWNINILSLAKPEDVEDNNKLLIGVSPVYRKGEENFERWDRNGWYLECMTSVLKSGRPHRINGKEYGPRKEVGEYVHAGDTVGVVMDMTTGELSFVLDGMNLGVAYEGIPLDRPLAPSIVLTRFGDSVELDPSEAKLLAVSNAITVPANVRVEARSWDSIVFAWDAVEDIPAYQVEADGDGMCIRTMENTYAMCRLLPGSEHKIRVRSVRRNEVSEWSDFVVGKSEEECPPFSECVWRDAGKSSVYGLDETNKRVATKTSARKFCKVLGNIPLPRDSVVSWSVKVLKAFTENRSRGEILIGVSPCDGEANSEDYDSEKGEEYFYASTFLSKIGLREETAKYVPIKQVCTGDTIGIVADTRKGSVSFVVNGVGYNYAKDNIPLDKPLVPCVVLFNEGDSVELDLNEVKENVSSAVPVPQEFAVSNSTWGSVTLGWDAVDGASFYQVEVDGELQRKVVTSCAFRKEGFCAESEHSFRVRCVKERAVSEWSELMKERTPSAPGFSECVWEEFFDHGERYEGKYAVDKENPRIVTSIDSENEPDVYGSVPLPRNELCSWSVKILELHVEPVYIGVAYREGDERNRWYIRCKKLQDYDNKVHKQWKQNRCYLNVGDTVGVVADMRKGEISFVVNGVNLGVTHSNVPLDKAIVPFVDLEKEGDSVELIPSEVKENVDSSIPVPPSIEAESKVCSTVTLSWDRVAEAKFYQVEVDGKKARNVPPSSQSKVTFDAENLFANSEHTFRVRCVGERCVGEWSEIVKVRTAPHPGFSVCSWKHTDDDSKKEYSIDESNAKIVTKVLKTGRWSSSYIVGSIQIPLNAVTKWAVKVLKSLNNDGKGITVGVSQSGMMGSRSRWVFDCYLSEVTPGNPGHEYGPRKKEGQYLHTGDSVGVVVDTTKGELSFEVNGVSLGVAFKEIPLDKPLVPFVELDSEGDSLELIN